MARCRCSEETCVCQAAAGPGIVIEGNGSASSPWLISSPVSAHGVVLFDDTPTINFTQSGDGDEITPYHVSATAIVGPLITFVDTPNMDWTVTGTGASINPLTIEGKVPCLDCTAPATPGYVLTVQADGSYKPSPATTLPAGSITKGVGLSGDGSVGSPLRVDLCTYGDLKAVCVP